MYLHGNYVLELRGEGGNTFLSFLPEFAPAHKELACTFFLILSPLPKYPRLKTDARCAINLPPL